LKFRENGPGLTLFLSQIPITKVLARNDRHHSPADVNYQILKEQKSVFGGASQFMIERRRDPRIEKNLPVRLWGVDERGCRFEQEAVASNFSSRGALLSGVTEKLKCGDLVGLAYRGKKARFRVVWIRDSRAGHKIQVAVQRLEHEKCPWRELLPESTERPEPEQKRKPEPNSVVGKPASPPHDHPEYTNPRRWSRHKLDVPLRVIIHRRGKSSIFIGRGNELSEGGMALTAGVELTPGDEVEIEFTPPYSGLPIRTRGTVRNRSGYRYGLEFLKRNSQETEQCEHLRAMLQTMSALPSQGVSDQGPFSRPS
jgi:hypothetical protein